MRLRLTSKFFFSLFFFFAISSSAWATTIISPVLELEADAGTIQPGVVKVYNETNATIFLIPSVEEFTAGNEASQPVYIPAQEQPDWLNWFIVGEDSLALDPGQAAVVPFVVNIPANAVPGGYYATIFWETVSPQQPGAGNVGVRSKVGTLILLKVKGEVVESGQIVEFSTSSNQPVFYQLPIIFSARFENNGNVHLQPQGTITIKNFLGQEKVFSLGDGKGNVLPNSTRKFEVVWGPTASTGNLVQKHWEIFLAEFKDFALGPLTATLNMEYGIDQPQQAKQAITFWIIPYHLLIGLVIILILVIALFKINSRIKKLKKKIKPNPAPVENETPQL